MTAIAAMAVTKVNSRNRIFITGGASGLGLAIARRYATEGWRVCVGDVHSQRGADAEKELRQRCPDSLYLHCDVTREGDLESVADRLQASWGGVDVVVNNAGVAQAGAIEDVPLADWRWIFDINFFGVVRGCKVFTRLFKEQGYGHIVNVASGAGLLDPPRMSSYNASKAAVVSLTETLQIELAKSNIGVTLICPSFFKTNLTESLRTTDPRMLTSMHRLFDRSRIGADDIAEQVYEAQQKKRFYVLPHSETRIAWRLKRLLPRKLYASIAVVVTRKMLGSPSVAPVSAASSTPPTTAA